MFLSIDAAESLSETVDNEHRERAQPCGYTIWDLEWNFARHLGCMKTNRRSEYKVWTHSCLHASRLRMQQVFHLLFSMCDDIMVQLVDIYCILVSYARSYVVVDKLHVNAMY